MKQVITDNGNYVLSAEVIECQNPNNFFQLKFTSKWRDAKNPNEEQVKFTAMFTKEELKYLSEFLKSVEL